MNEEIYLKKARRALWKIKKEKRDEIILELRSEIEDRLNSGEKIDSILEDLPTPKELKKNYESIYGPSFIIKLFFFIASVIISLFTTPTLPFTSIVFYGAPAFLLLLALLLFYISTNFGIKFGLLTSGFSSLFRFTLIFLTSMYFPLEEGTLLTESFSSIIIFIIPFFTNNKK